MSNTTCSNKITLRIYDESFVRELNNMYLVSKEKFESKNHFFITIMRLGLDAYANSSHYQHKEAVADTKELIRLNDLLLKFIDYVKDQNDIHNAHFNICEKLMSCTMSVVESIANGDSISMSAIDNGEYDELPERFEKILLEVKYK